MFNQKKGGDLALFLGGDENPVQKAFLHPKKKNQIGS